jgi:hypothetical protein
MVQATAGVWVTDPEAYRKKMFGLLGDRDPIEVMSRTADVLATIVREHTPGQMRARPYPGKWTPNEVIGHLVDTEWVYGFRTRHIYCEHEPTIIGMDQEIWVERQKHNDREPMELVEMFRVLRKQTIALWKQMTPADHQRQGRHNERGLESLGTMLRMEAGHDLSHIDQIQRYLAAVKAAK